MEDTKFVIKKGTMVFISANAIQNDPEIYPNPSVFDPERFTPEEVAKRSAYAFLPFGAGPRNCIGEFFLLFLFMNFYTIRSFQVSALE